MTTQTGHDQHPGGCPPELFEILQGEMRLVDTVIAQACRRYRLSAADADDFGGLVRMRLVENDFGVLRRFEGRSSLRSYLTTVVFRLLLDYRVRQWGRWRPSTEAVLRGRPGLLLDRLLHRDGLTFEEACEVIQTNYGLKVTREELSEIAAQLPPRANRRLEPLDAYESPAEHGCPDIEFQRQEAVPIALRMKRELKAALAALPDDDRRLLELRFRDGRTVIEIAQLLGVTPKPLYRRLERIARALRGRLLDCPRSRSLGVTAFTLSGVNISW